jgi:hypothetical protein
LIVTFGIAGAAVLDQLVTTMSVVFVANVLGAVVVIVAILVDLATRVDRRIDAHVVALAAVVVGARILVVAVGVACAAAGNPLVEALGVRRTERNTRVHRAHRLVDTVFVGAAAPHGHRVLARVCDQVAGIDRANVAVVALGVESTASVDRAVSAVSVRSALALAHIFGAHQMIVTLGARRAATGDVRTLALLGAVITVLRRALVVIVAVRVAQTAVGNRRVRALTKFVTHVVGARIMIVAFGIACAATFDWSRFALIRLGVAHFVGAPVVVVAVAVLDTAPLDADVLALLMNAVRQGADVLIVFAIVGRIATTFDLVGNTLVRSHVAKVVCASVAVVALSITRAASLDDAAHALARHLGSFGTNARKNLAKATVVVVVFVRTIFVFEAAPRERKIKTLVLVGACIERARIMIVTILRR